jgi:hypothetical protein
MNVHDSKPKGQTCKILENKEKQAGADEVIKRLSST